MAYIEPVIKKKYDLSFKLTTQLGYGHLRRNIGNFNTNYNALNYGSQIIALPPALTLSATEASVIQVITDSPVQFFGTLPDDSVIELTVNKILLLDQKFKSWRVSNLGMSEAKVLVHWASDAEFSAPIVITNYVTSVNGVAPDASGNVLVDTGVMSVSGELPDGSGNVNTDEGFLP